MKAAVLHEIGTPLRIEEVELDPPGENEISIRWVATGVCHSDYSVAHGVLKSPLPVVLGHEGGGIVEEVGSGVTHLEPGDHVITALTPSCGACEPCRDDRPYLCVQTVPTMGHNTMVDGTTRLRIGATPVYHLCGLASFAERAVVPAGAAIPVPADVSLETACLIGCGVTTGVGAALNTAQVRAESTAVVVGCGGVGLSIIQGCRIAGAATIIAVDPMKEKRDLALSLGATHGIDPRAEDPVRAVRKITGPGAQYAFEAIGRIDTIEQIWSMIRPGGDAIVVGMPSLAESVKLRASGFFQHKRLTGSLYGSSAPKRDFPRFLELYRKGELRLDEMITRRIALEDVNDALEAMGRGEGARSVVVFGGA